MLRVCGTRRLLDRMISCGRSGMTIAALTNLPICLSADVPCVYEHRREPTASRSIGCIIACPALHRHAQPSEDSNEMIYILFAIDHCKGRVRASLTSDPD